MRHWIFDLDGTLVDSFSHYFELLQEIFDARRMRFGPELRLAALSDPLPLFFQRHLGRAAVDSALEELQARSQSDAALVKPFAGVPELLAKLRSSGSRVGVWTNRDLVSASLILKHSGLDAFAEICVSGTCVTRRKPHPEGLSRIIGHFESDPAQITMVGDHSHDVEAAKAVGARAVRASWHGYWAMERCPHADAQFDDFADFERWVFAGSQG